MSAPTDEISGPRSPVLEEGYLIDMDAAEEIMVEALDGQLLGKKADVTTVTK